MRAALRIGAHGGRAFPGSRVQTIRCASRSNRSAAVRDPSGYEEERRSGSETPARAL